MKTHWKQLVNPDYLGAYSLPDGNDMTIKIKQVVREIVKGLNGKSEECTVAHIEGNKPLILNRTNCKTIAKLYGSPFIEDWAGKSIKIYAAVTKLKGDDVECLRIRDEVIEKPKVTTDQLQKAKQAIESGTITKEQAIDKLKKSFSLTPEIEKAL